VIRVNGEETSSRAPSSAAQTGTASTTSSYPGPSVPSSCPRCLSGVRVNHTFYPLDTRAGKESLLSISRAWILNEMVWYGSAAICAARDPHNPDQRLVISHTLSQCAGPWRGKPTHQEVLPIPVGDFDLLLKRRHESVSRLDPVLDLGVVHLEQQPELSRDRIANLGDLVPGQANLDKLLGLHARFQRRLLLRELLRIARRVVCVSGRPTGEVRLVLLALRVREVGPFVRVQGEAQPALQPAEVVPEDVRIFREVDRLERELPEPFSPIDRLLIRTSDATAAEFTANAILTGEGVSRGSTWAANTSGGFS
jgi:hypothetical protein